MCGCQPSMPEILRLSRPPSALPPASWDRSLRARAPFGWYGKYRGQRNGGGTLWWAGTQPVGSGGHDEEIVHHADFAPPTPGVSGFRRAS
jgi:hypothetical protein